MGKVNPLTLKVEEFIKGNKNKYTTKQICDHFKLSEDRVNGIIRRRHLRELILYGGSSSQEVPVPRKTKKEVTAEARLESQLRKVSKDKSEGDRKYRALQDENADLHQALADALEIMGRTPTVFKIKPSGPKNKGSGTVVALASDWHVDEIIPKNKVNGLNEHNPDIAKRRAERFFDLLVRFLRIEREETNIDQVVIWLGGDFYTSSESHGTPVAFDTMTAAMFAQDLLVSGLKFLQEQEPDLKIHIVCSVGNHSRIEKAKPVNIPREQELSIEWMMYHALRQIFPNISWQIDSSYHSYTKIYDKTVRFNHGHVGWRYNQGLGGVHGPLWKVISQVWDNQIAADLTCCGHYHTLTPASLARPYMVNGSNVGVSPYGASYGFEPPAQMFFLIHSKYGIVGQRPLFVDM